MKRSWSINSANSEQQITRWAPIGILHCVYGSNSGYLGDGTGYIQFEDSFWDKYESVTIEFRRNNNDFELATFHLINGRSIIEVVGAGGNMEWKEVEPIIENGYSTWTFDFALGGSATITKLPIISNK